MNMKEICPCPNLDCPNHGYCDKCISRHLRLGYLNYCSFQTILPALQEAIAASPESPTAEKLQSIVTNQSKAYAMLMEKHGLSKEDQKELCRKVAELGAEKSSN